IGIPGAASTMALTIVLAKTPGAHWVGHIDILGANLREYPLINITDEAGVLTATMSSPGAAATVQAKIEDAGARLTGHFKQAGYDLALDLKRTESHGGFAAHRPQQPRPPYPYETREVNIAAPAGFTLAGTITIPNGDGPFPAAVMITGSGQQDRDESLMGHKPFLVIADYLTRHGMAVLRCDDRGVGGSGGAKDLEKATTKD